MKILKLSLQTYLLDTFKFEFGILLRFKSRYVYTPPAAGSSLASACNWRSLAPCLNNFVLVHIFIYEHTNIHTTYIARIYEGMRHNGSACRSCPILHDGSASSSCPILSRVRWWNARKELSSLHFEFYIRYITCNLIIQARTQPGTRVQEAQSKARLMSQTPRARRQIGSVPVGTRIPIKRKKPST